jgi:hypothetical protein
VLSGAAQTRGGPQTAENRRTLADPRRRHFLLLPMSRSKSFFYYLY